MTGVKVDAEKLVIPIKELPSLPAIQARVLQLATNESTTVEELEEVIRIDQALTAKVLRVANSAVYGFKRTIETIPDAIVAMGTRKLRAVASAASLAGLFKDSGLVEGKRLWLHSLATALWSERLAPGPAPTFLFTAGLMHDLGIVVLDQFASDSYHKILSVTRKGNFSLHAVEHRFLGTTHAEVGGLLCKTWKLPAGLVHLIGAQFDEHPSEDVLKIRLAECLANQGGFTNFEWATPRPIPDDLLEALGFDHEQLVELRERETEAIEHEVDALRDL